MPLPGPLLCGLEKYCELDLPKGILSKVSYDGDISVITLTGQWGLMINVAFEFKGNTISIKDGKLVGIRLKENNIVEIISEKGSCIEINGQNWDYCQCDASY